MLDPVVRRVLSKLPPAAPTVLGIVVVLLVVVFAAGGESAVEVGQGWVPGFNRQVEGQGADAGERSEDEFEAPPVVRTVAALVMVALLLAMVLLFVIGLLSILFSVRFKRFRKRRPEAVTPTEVSGDDDDRIDVSFIHRAAGGALEQLRQRAGGDPGDAVVLAWLVMEEAAAECGLARLAHQTATEFTTAVLAGLDVDPRALHRLRRLYQRARFSTHPVTEADADAAEDALRRLVDDLAATAGVPA